MAASGISDRIRCQEPWQYPAPWPRPTRTSGLRLHRGAGFDIVPERPTGFVALLAQCHTGLPRGARSRSALPATKQAAGAPSAWSQPSLQPTSDHADGATLDRWDARASQRSRRPVMRSGSGTAAALFSGHEPPTRFSNRAPRECPLKRCLGPKRVAFGGGAPSQNRFETARPVKANTASPQGTHPAFFRGTRLGPRKGCAEHPAPTGCRVRICAGMTSRRRVPSSTNADRAPPGSAIRSALPATRQAAGAPSAWSQPSLQPTSDHADGATLDRWDASASRRTRRPGLNSGLVHFMT